MSYAFSVAKCMTEEASEYFVITRSVHLRKGVCSPTVAVSTLNTLEYYV